jgi:tripartite-type tricarboxylate transporter receptor subunit TctC
LLRRRFLRDIGLAWVGFAFTACIPSLASGAGACPSLDGRTIRWIVPWALGGGYDTYSRLVAPFYAEALGASIQLENMPGAAGLVGARAINRSRPDGLTIGIVTAAGLMSTALVGGDQIPDPAADFTLLARVGGSQHVWASAADSELRSIDDLFGIVEKRPIIFGAPDAGSISFISIALGSDILKVPREIVAGYFNTSNVLLAALRGEVDVVSMNFESALDSIEAGHLRPLLQLADSAISEHPSLTGVPLLGGNGGIAADRARALQLDPHAAEEDASALAALIGTSRIIVAPPGLDDALSSCMERALVNTLTAPELAAAAARLRFTLDVAGSDDVLAGLAVAAGRMSTFAPIVKRAILEARSY